MSEHTSLISIDPGSEQSAYVRYCLVADTPIAAGIEPNAAILKTLHAISRAPGYMLAVEMIASYGMPVGKTVFDTCLWIGRFIEAWGGPYELVYRKDVKMHLCGTTRAKDSNVRQSLIDRFGPGKAKAIGLKKTPGPLYGFKADMWAALAVAVTFADLHELGTAHD